MIVALFFTIFAIVGITIFKGHFEGCKTEQISLSKEQIIKLIQDEYSCLNYGGEWETYFKNFNNLGTALL